MFRPTPTTSYGAHEIVINKGLEPVAGTGIRYTALVNEKRFRWPNMK